MDAERGPQRVIDSMPFDPDAAIPDARASADLAQRIHAGDRGAGAEFAARFRAWVTVVVRRRRPPRDPRVDDLVQDILLTALLSLREGKVRQVEHLPGFVHGIALHVLAAAERKQGRQDGALNPIDTDQIEADEPEPATQIQKRQRDALVRALLHRLPVARDRQALWRLYVLEHDRERICRELELSPERLNQVLFRARERFRKIVQGGLLDVE